MDDTLNKPIDDSLYKLHIKLYTPLGVNLDVSIRPIDHKDPHKVEVPYGAYAFQFFERAEAIIDGQITLGNIRGNSVMYYFGKEIKLDELLVENPDSDWLNDFKKEGVERVVLSMGKYYPLSADDVVLRKR